jgi:type II secretory pathway component GspD/PulD (secretin)
VANGETVAAGGWATRPGRRALALTTPDASAAPGTVLVRSRIIEAPDEVWASVGLAQIRAQGSEGFEIASLTREQMGSILRLLEASPGVDVLSAPSVVTGDGNPAHVSVGQPEATPDRSPRFQGIQISITPRPSADRQTVDLGVDARMTLPRTGAAR